ncbi:uncharacterized protein LOC130890783 isoform X2 [Diorhabda carinulata]|uniref:uncharacterized protein LOC130890783 isoform X2 n=1 Tax=Diorhabda carinulata TaxID=1163345 RepID=UPI0025A073C9|nr:uncharacterized protein LOC130890783 isoform X2 [Diorhabda carinulata]
MPMKIYEIEKSRFNETETLWNFLISNNFGNKLIKINMSRPMNMLRTRRKDCNVKPNRRDNNRATRLDRKSSRGMIYENEELRLKTININAEVESRQSDIKKLKKENEMLKKGLWYLRDEYDKLEKLIKDKKIDFSSSSTTGSTSSDSESFSSYSDDEEEVETTQNMKNVQRTNLRNLQDQFDHLSVVTEETSAENSELHSNTGSVNKENWNDPVDILQPDQSYPQYRCLAKSPTLPMADNIPVNFFTPIRNSKSFDANIQQCNDVIYPEEFYNNQFRSSTSSMINQSIKNEHNFARPASVKTSASDFYQNTVFLPKATSNPELQIQGLEKSATDLIVKVDNQTFNDTPIIFSNTPTHSTFSNGGNLEELLQDIESISQKATHHPNTTGYGFRDDYGGNNQVYTEKQEEASDKAYKSELNVVLVPNPMPLIGTDKYKNVQRSLENVATKFSDELTAPQHPLPMETNLTPIAPYVSGTNEVNLYQKPDVETNPFFFGNIKDNYVNADHFSMRYNPELFRDNNDTKRDVDSNRKFHSENTFKNENTQTVESENLAKKGGSKTNLLDLTSSDHISSENEDKLKAATNEKADTKYSKSIQMSGKSQKSPKLSIRKKVSIHFKGKKEKNKNSYSSDSSIPKTSTERKGSIFDAKFSDRGKIVHQKPPSSDTQKSITETNARPKTPTSSDSKNSTEKKSQVKETSIDKKLTKSTSVSPDRKHVQLKDDVQSKKHKKHKKGEKCRPRRHSNAGERVLRERSFSICTDRSNILEHRMGLGFGSNLYFDEFSDRERTNSLSSCDTAEHRRKMSMLPNVALTGKVPWCGCWGNGCL